MFGSGKWPFLLDFRKLWVTLAQHLTRTSSIPWILEPARQFQSQLTKDLLAGIEREGSWCACLAWSLWRHRLVFFSFALSPVPAILGSPSVFMLSKLLHLLSQAVGCFWQLTLFSFCYCVIQYVQHEYGNAPGSFWRRGYWESLMAWLLPHELLGTRSPRAGLVLFLPSPRPRRRWTILYGATATTSYSMFFQDGLTGSAWGDWANYTASPWISPFEFNFHLSEQLVITIHLLQGDDAYFLHIFRIVVSRFLWKRAAQRKSLASIRTGVDKVATLKLHNSKNLEPYDKGILRGILADAICAQKHLRRSKQAAFSMCPYCWQETEDLEHLYWRCERWSEHRSKYLSPQQLSLVPGFPISVRRAGIFPFAATQLDVIFQDHGNLSGSSQLQWPLHTCTFPSQLQLAMIAVIHARNKTKPDEPPADFIPPPMPPKVNGSNNDDPPSDTRQKPSDRPVVHKPTHDEHGLLLSTSNRPGGSKYQHVQSIRVAYRAVIPYQGRRNSFGPFFNEIDAAKKVKEIFEQIQDGSAATTRGKKTH